MGTVMLDPSKRWECPSCGAQHVTREPRPHTPMHRCHSHHGLDMPLAEVVGRRTGLARGKVVHRVIEREDYTNGDMVQLTNGRAVMAVHTERSDGHDTHVYAPTAVIRGEA